MHKNQFNSCTFLAQKLAGNEKLLTKTSTFLLALFELAESCLAKYRTCHLWSEMNCSKMADR